MKLRGLIPNFYILVPERLIVGIAHRYRNVEIGIQNIIILFWKYRGHAVSFLGLHKLALDIYIGFSPALYFQCRERWDHLIKKVTHRALRPFPHMYRLEGSK